LGLIRDVVYEYFTVLTGWSNIGRWSNNYVSLGLRLRRRNRLKGSHWSYNLFRRNHNQIVGGLWKYIDLIGYKAKKCKFLISVSLMCNGSIINLYD
jgi:hypothetical protein